MKKRVIIIFLLLLMMFNVNNANTVIAAVIGAYEDSTAFYKENAAVIELAKAIVHITSAIYFILAIVIPIICLYKKIRKKGEIVKSYFTLETVCILNVLICYIASLVTIVGSEAILKRNIIVIVITSLLTLFSTISYRKNSRKM